MTPPESTEPDVAWQRRILFGTALLMVLLVRALLISNHGSDIPFMDQWDSEIMLLYKPWSEGAMGPGALFSAHNEHRIALTRLVGLGLFWLNSGQFDNLVAQFFNAALYAAALGLLLWPLFERVRGAALMLAVLATLAVGGLPYAHENLSSGFQNAFFFLNALAAAALALLLRQRATTPSLLGVATISIVSLFSLASGLLLAPVLGVIAAMRYRNGGLSARQCLALITAATFALALGVALLPAVPAHSSLRPADVGDALGALSGLLAWPLPRGWLSVLLLWTPSAIWLLAWWRTGRASETDSRRYEMYWFGIAAWVLLQALAVAASRGHDLVVIPSRYLDTLVFGAVANLLLAVALMQRLRSNTAQSRAYIALAASSTLLAVCLVGWGLKGSHALSQRMASLDVAAAGIRAYLAGGSSAVSDGKSPMELSYPSAERLVQLLDDPGVRQLLPPTLRLPLPLDFSQCAFVINAGNGILATPDAQAGMPSGSCTSAMAETVFPYLRLGVAGYVDDKHLALDFIGENGKVRRLRYSSTAAVDAWTWQRIRMPSGRFALRVTDDSGARGFAWAPPVEEGRLSALAARLADWLQTRL